MIQKLLIVESPNDAAFISLLLKHLSIKDTDTQTIDATEIDHLHNFTGMDGKEKRGKDALPEKLKMVERDLSKKYPHIQHIGIILDVDMPKPNTFGGKERSIELINTAIKSAFHYDPAFTEIGQKRDATIYIEKQEVLLQFSCYLMLDDKGVLNLDEALKSIAKQTCPTADCLVDMNNCVKSKTGDQMGDFNKQWINYYIRCFANKKQINNAEKRLHEVISEEGSHLFDLDSPLLVDLKDYLAQNQPTIE